MPMFPRRFVATARWLVAATLLGIGTAHADDARVRPPSDIDCPRDRLTLYGGRVLSVRHDPARTTIRLRTDWDTTERVTVPHPRPEDVTQRFRIDGQPFQAADWARVLGADGRARAGLRAAAWVCNDGRPPLVDWQPARPR